MAIIESLHFEEADMAEFCSVHGYGQARSPYITGIEEPSYPFGKLLYIDSGAFVYKSNISTSTIYYRFLLYVNRFPSSTANVLHLNYVSEDSLYIRLNPDGTLSLEVLGSVVGTTTATVPRNTVIEIMCCSKRADGNSRFELKALGETIVDLTSAAPATINVQYLGDNATTNAQYFIDELESNDYRYPKSLFGATIIDSLHFEETNIAEFDYIHGTYTVGDAELSTVFKYAGNQSIHGIEDAPFSCYLPSVYQLPIVYGRFMVYLTNYTPNNNLIYGYWATENSIYLTVDVDGIVTTQNLTTNVSTIPLNKWTEVFIKVENPGTEISGFSIGGQYSYFDEFEINDSEYPPSLMDTNNYTISTLNNVSLTNFKVV